MDFSRWTREKSIIAPSVKKYRVYTPYRGGEKEELYTGRKKSHFLVFIFFFMLCNFVMRCVPLTFST